MAAGPFGTGQLDAVDHVWVFRRGAAPFAIAIWLSGGNGESRKIEERLNKAYHVAK